MMKTFLLGHKPLTLLALDAIVYMLKYTETTLVITLLRIISLNGSTVDPSWPVDFIYVHNASLDWSIYY